ncbi:uncharacterized protein LOC116188454 isoform X2 [Punica granatum]|uniref:Uncharacterized protein LOC116188454 isoform X2 n=1 Tax=Punica granatum TaxID=22663 RepID=A0A6P8BTP3_PUNGR|nr:uncharacterized protein LOC116188454 isoform X2 [Punica granatum]
MRDPSDSGNPKLKRDRRNCSETSEGAERKAQVKMRELKYLMGLEAKTSELLDDKGPPCRDQDMSEVTDEPVAISTNGSLPTEPEAIPAQLDLNAEPCTATNPDGDSNHREACSLRKHKKPCEDDNSASSRGLDLDLNVEDVPSQNPFHPYKKLDEQAKSKDVSECASSNTGPLEEKEKDPLKIWKEMKQNGFLSSSHGGIPVPKQRGRKIKNELLLKKRLELARKEHADKFAKLAAPSGLLNELNPGIINHVRNRRQVHSIIEALVKSEKPPSGHIGSRKGNHSRAAGKEHGTRKESGTFSDLGANWQKMSRPVSFNRSAEHGEHSIGPDMVGRMFTASLGPQYNPFNQNDPLALKLSASMGKASEASMSNEGSTNLGSVTSLSVKAATIASQWLELLHQDIKGRLAALRRSKKRVQAVISTELPFLISKEFSSDQENNPFAVKNYIVGPTPTAANAHRLRWSALFDQMDKALSEEEQQLEIWLNQVKEMQMHCEQGLQSANQYSTAYGLQNPGTTENMSRSGKADSSERELAVKAAAASIYSTCNFLLSKGDVSCF